jgi:hypothetical protein
MNSVQYLSTKSSMRPSLWTALSGLFGCHTEKWLLFTPNQVKNTSLGREKWTIPIFILLTKEEILDGMFFNCFVFLCIFYCVLPIISYTFILDTFLHFLILLLYLFAFLLPYFYYVTTNNFKFNNFSLPSLSCKYPSSFLFLPYWWYSWYFWFLKLH